MTQPNQDVMGASIGLVIQSPAPPHTQKYGALKQIVLSPWFQWLMEKIDDLLSIELIGEPRMAPVPIVMLLFMLFKSKQRTSVIALFAAFFLNLHPVFIVGAFVGVTVWARLRRPKGYDPAKPPPRTAPYIDVRCQPACVRDVCARHTKSCKLNQARPIPPQHQQRANDV